MSTGTDDGLNQEPEKYSFLQEKIKDETFSVRKLLYKFFRLAGRGFLFGIAASISFFALKPWIESVFPKNPNTIELPKDDEMKEVSAETETASVPQQMTMDEYKKLNGMLVRTAQETKKSVVEVKSMQTDRNFAEETKRIINECAGVLVADNGQELLLLTNTFVLNDAQEMWVTFSDGTQCGAALKEKDENIGLAVLGVRKDEIRDSAWESIKIAQLGNSNEIEQGKPIIAIGNPFGYSEGMGVGIVSSQERNMTLADGEYHMLVTDMPTAEKSSGVFVNVDGEVVGIIVPSREGTLTAFGVSTIKGEIELMLNGREVPYIGIVGRLVTKDISEKWNIPEGVWVTEVIEDSPAMKAGILNGDIITDIGDRKIETVMGYHRTMNAQKVGENIPVRGKRRGTEEYVEIQFDVAVDRKE